MIIIKYFMLCWWVLVCCFNYFGHTSRTLRRICVTKIFCRGPKTLRYVIRITAGINMMMLIIIANDISSSKSQILVPGFSSLIPYFTNITIPNIEKIKMMVRIQSMAVQNKTIQSSSPKVLLYGSRYKSLRLGNWKEASEMFVTKVHNIFLLDFNVWLEFDARLPSTAAGLLKYCGNWVDVAYLSCIHGLRMPNDAFFHWNPKLLGLGRQIEQIWVFSAILVLWVPCPCFPLFLQKTKPLNPHPKYLFGFGIWIWAAKN